MRRVIVGHNPIASPFMMGVIHSPVYQNHYEGIGDRDRAIQAMKKLPKIKEMYDRIDLAMKHGNRAHDDAMTKYNRLPGFIRAFLSPPRNRIDDQVVIDYHKELDGQLSMASDLQTEIDRTAVCPDQFRWIELEEDGIIAALELEQE